MPITSSAPLELTADQMDVLQNAFWDNANVDEPDLRTDYSGRGMYGRTCVGFVVTDVREAVCVLLAVANEDSDLATQLASCLTTDSMGRDLIVYFPNVHAPEGA